MGIEKESCRRDAEVSSSLLEGSVREKLARIAGFERRLANLGFQVQVMGDRTLETEDVLDHVIGVALTIDELQHHPERIHLINNF